MMRGNRLPALATISTYLETPRVLSFPILRRTAQSGYSSLSKRGRCRALAVPRAYSPILHPHVATARLSRPWPLHPHVHPWSTCTRCRRAVVVMGVFETS